MSETNGHEKSPLKSKKFIAFLISEITWKMLAAFVLMWAWNDAAIGFNAFIILLAIIVVAGFVETGFILGQGSIDKYIRLAQIAADAGSKMVTKGVTIGPSDKAPVPDKTDLDRTDPAPAKTPDPKKEDGEAD